MPLARLWVGALLCALGLAAHAAPPGDDLPVALRAPNLLQPDALVEAVLARSPTEAAAAAAVETARAHAQAEQALLPTTLTVSTAPLSWLPSDHGHGVGATVGVQQPLRPFGLREAQEATTSAQTRAATHDREATRQQLAHAARSLHAAWWKVHQDLAHNSDLHAILDELLATAERRAAVGEQDPPALARLRLRRAALARERLALEARKTTVQAQLNALLHAPPDAQPGPPAPVLAAPSTTGAPSPAVAAAEARVAAAAAARDAAQAQSGPGLNLMSEYSTMWENRPHRWMLGVGIRLPLDARGARAAIDRAAAAQTRAQHLAAAAAATEQAAQTAAEAELVRAQKTLAHLVDVERPLARELLAATQARYAAGDLPLAELLTAAIEADAVERATTAATAALALAAADRELAHSAPLGASR